jgi:hypothetical protein
MKVMCFKGKGESLSAFFALSLSFGVLAPQGALAKVQNKKKSADIAAAKLMARDEAEVNTLVEDKFYTIKYDGVFVGVEIIEGDLSTVSIDGSLFSFDSALSEEANIEQLASFLTRELDLSSKTKKPSQLLSRIGFELDSLLFPRAEASFVKIALIATVVAAAVFLIVKASKKKKNEKKMAKKEADYSAKIKEQFVKGDNFKNKNAPHLAGNSKQWQFTREKNPHNCYIASRAYHDHMKYYEKGYAPNPNNYRC